MDSYVDTENIIKNSQAEGDIFPGLKSELLDLVDHKETTIDQEVLQKAILSFPIYLRELQQGIDPKENIEEIYGKSNIITQAFKNDLTKASEYLKQKFAFVKQVPESLREIGYFRVTSRHAASYEKYLQFSPSDLPRGSVVVDSGSGYNQELAQKLSKHEVTVISMDATLALPINERFYDPYIPKDDKILYDVVAPDTNEIIQTTEEMRKSRRLNSQENTIAAVMPNIPIKDQSVDYFFDLFGPGMYLSEEKQSKYFSEMYRVIKQNGSGRMYPVDTFEEFVTYMEDHESDIRISSAKIRVKAALVKAGVPLAKIEFYEMEDSKGKRRLGMIMKK